MENGGKNGLPAVGTLYEFDGFEVDPANRTCTCGGRTLELTGKVFDVLLAFVENPGSLILKSELMEMVWPGEFVEEGNLARSVSSLRKALGDDPKSHKYIVTVQGRGYRFAADLSRTVPNPVGTNGDSSIHSFQTKVPNNGRQPTASRADSNRNRKYLFITASALLGLAIAVGIWLIPSWRSALGLKHAAIDSIAVLPFENSTGNADLDYLSDGITENVINAISPLANLRVLPRNAVFSYKNKVQDPYSAGTALGVRTVLTGIVIERNNKLTIQTELIDVESRAQIWGRQFDYDSSDISSIQTNIAQQVVNSLQTGSSDSEKQELARRTTANPEAQKAHMWGLYFLNQALNDPTQKSFELREKSIDILQQATKLDPNYAQAYADLARSYLSIAGFGENGRMAKDAAQTALQRDETNSTAHAVLGAILWQNDWDWAGAEREFIRAAEISPNEAHADYAELLSAECRHEEAIREIKIAEELEPLNLQIKARKGFIYKDARQYDLAIEEFKAILQMNSNLIDARFGLIEAYALNGNNADAEAESQTLLSLTDRYDTRLFVGSIYAHLGRHAEAIEIYEDYKKEAHQTSILMASIAASEGDNDAAFFWLEKAFSTHNRFLLGLKASPMLDPLHGDARFAALLKRMGLPT